MRWTRDGVPVTPAGDAPVARGWLTGEAVYETVIVRSSLPSTWPLHRERLRAGAAACALPWPGDAAVDRVAQAALRDARASGIAGFVRLRLDLVASGGAPASAPPDATLWGRCVALTERVRPAAHLTLGPRLRNAADPLAGVKRASVASDLLALRAARARGFDDVLLLDVAGRLSEASTSALVLGLADGRLVTPSPQAAPLPSTTLALLRHDGLAIADAELRPEDLAEARFAVLLNAVQGARPVRAIDGVALGAPPPPLIARARRLVDDSP